MADRLWYLASPYTNYPYGQDQAAHDVAKIAAELTKMDFTVYSPIVHCHYIADHMDNHLDADFWIKHQRTILDKCDGAIVAMLEDWHLSKGTAAEEKLFKDAGKPVLYAQYKEHPRVVRVEDAPFVAWQREVKLFDYGKLSPEV